MPVHERCKRYCAQIHVVSGWNGFQKLAAIEKIHAFEIANLEAS